MVTLTLETFIGHTVLYFLVTIFQVGRNRDKTPLILKTKLVKINQNLTLESIVFFYSSDVIKNTCCI